MKNNIVKGCIIGLLILAGPIVAICYSVKAKKDSEKMIKMVNNWSSNDINNTDGNTAKIQAITNKNKEEE